MRMSWRSTVLVMLALVWPHLGCVQLPIGKSVEEIRPPQEKRVTAQRQEAAPEEMAQTLLNNADALAMNGKSGEAIALCEQIRQGGGVPAYYATKKIAFLYYQSDDMDRAELEYQKVLHQNQHDVEAMCKLGDICNRRGRWGIAEKYFAGAVKENPNNVYARSGLAWALAQQGAYDASLKEFTQVLSEVEAYCQIAQVMKTQCKREDAIRALETAVSLDKNSVRARQELAMMKRSEPTAGSKTIVRSTAPPQVKEKQGTAELEEAGPELAQGFDENMNRWMMQRRTLPPLPDIDLTEGSGREWECSAQKKKCKN